MLPEFTGAGSVHKANALHNTNKLKLGLFSLNADGGIAITKVPERWQAGRPEIAEVAKMVDRAGEFDVFGHGRGHQSSASRFRVARKLRLRVPIRLVPNTSAWSPAKVPVNPLAISWPPASGRTKGSDSRVCWLVRSSPFHVPSPHL